MAKGNLFLGLGRRSVGDVVLYRRNGEQVSRARVRKIGNPKSDGQALQRSYMAAVSKFYSFFKSPLEKSWQGLNKSQSQSAFLKANANLVRENGYYVTKGFGLAPLPLQVSKGTLQRVAATLSTGGVSLREGAGALSGSSDSIGTFTNYMVSLGFSVGDQVTFVGVMFDDDLGYFPRWCRVVLSADDKSSLADVLDVFGGGYSPTVSDDIMTRFNLAGVSYDIAAFAVIVSRYSGGEWQRSTEFMASSEEWLRNFTGDEARAAAIASYQGASSVPVSDVYLNGSTEESTEPVPAGVWPYDAQRMWHGATYKYVIPQSVSPIANLSVVQVISTVRSSGATVMPCVINNKAGDPNFGKMLVWSGTTSETAWATAPEGKFDYIRLDYSSDLETWLNQFAHINWGE